MRLAKLGLASKAIYDSAQALQAAIDNGDSVGAARAAISLAGAVYAMLAGGCFAAGTPILTPDGSKLIEDIRPGDWVITAPDDDPDAQPVPRRVEEIFENYLPLLDLYVNGRTIRTTAEHPFWVRDRGWVAAHQLEAGDELRTHAGRWLKLDGLEGPKASETVYNMCVAEYHTYFIGDQIWGFAVWSHNAAACVT
jgi:Pretoxin HINT domain